MEILISVQPAAAKCQSSLIAITAIATILYNLHCKVYLGGFFLHIIGASDICKFDICASLTFVSQNEDSNSQLFENLFAN